MRSEIGWSPFVFHNLGVHRFSLQIIKKFVVGERKHVLAISLCLHWLKFNLTLLTFHSIGSWVCVCFFNCTKDLSLTCLGQYIDRSGWLMAWLQHEADLHALARALLENETLNAKEVRQILSHPLEQGDEVATVSMMQSWPDKEDVVVLEVQTGTTTQWPRHLCFFSFSWVFHLMMQLLTH